MKKSVPVDQLLQWAYRDELPKRVPDPTDGRGLSIYSYGTAIDCSYEPGFPPAVGEAHPDAAIIDAAVAGLTARTMGQPLTIEWPANRDYLAPDCGGVLNDFEIALAALDFDLGLELACHAKMGTCPAWEHEPFRSVRRKSGANGAPMMIGAMLRGRVYEIGSHCPVDVVPDPREVVADRARYAAWYEGLIMLRSDLTNQLADYVPAPPTAAARPWVTPNAKITVLADLRIPAIPIRRARRKGRIAA